MSLTATREVSGFRADVVTRLATEMGLPDIKAMVRMLSTKFRDQVTLLSVCPNSESVTRAALRAGQKVNAPVIFAATLNQVDIDGGYTGWTPSSFVRFIRDYRRALGTDVPVLACLDHGGPWLKDSHTSERLTLEETMAATKRSIEGCLDAGYALMHIDPTVDRTLPSDAGVPIDLVVARTLELLAHAEHYRKSQKYPPVSYEVGTEEVHGGLADAAVFDRFLLGLDVGLREAGITAAWPAFVVGKVGTDLHTTYFDARVARELTAKVRHFGALIKGHYSDYVENPKDYPLSGMGGANVGPEFTEEEYRALAELVALERTIGRKSGFEDALRFAVISSGRWKKWLTAAERGRRFERLSEERQGWLLRTGSRYVWAEPDVLEARKRLYNNVRDHRDADAFVLWRIEQAILKYYHNFNLVNFNDRLIDTMAGASTGS